MTPALRFAILFSLCSPLVAGAQVFRCTDAAGKVHFADQPCAPGQASREVKIDKHPTLPPVQAGRMSPEAVAYLKDRERRQQVTAARPGATPRVPDAVLELRSTNYDVHKCVEARRRTASMRLYEGIGPDYDEWERRAQFYCGQ